MTLGNTHITIVICTYNRSALLRDAVRSFQRLRTDDRFSYDVLIVDNASNDDTPDVIQQLLAESEIPVHGVREAKPGVAAARNRGIAEAQGEWIAFCDDDGSRQRKLCVWGSVDRHQEVSKMQAPQRLEGLRVAHR